MKVRTKAHHFLFKADDTALSAIHQSKCGDLKNRRAKEQPLFSPLLCKVGQDSEDEKTPMKEPCHSSSRSLTLCTLEAGFLTEPLLHRGKLWCGKSCCCSRVSKESHMMQQTLSFCCPPWWAEACLHAKPAALLFLPFASVSNHCLNSLEGLPPPISLAEFLILLCLPISVSSLANQVCFFLELNRLSGWADS